MLINAGILASGPTWQIWKKKTPDPNIIIKD
jgi:hypothetical protein